MPKNADVYLVGFSNAHHHLAPIAFIISSAFPEGSFISLAGLLGQAATKLKTQGEIKIHFCKADDI